MTQEETASNEIISGQLPVKYDSRVDFAQEATDGSFMHLAVDVTAPQGSHDVYLTFKRVGKFDGHPQLPISIPANPNPESNRYVASVDFSSKFDGVNG